MVKRGKFLIARFLGLDIHLTSKFLKVCSLGLELLLTLISMKNMRMKFGTNGIKLKFWKSILKILYVIVLNQRILHVITTL